MPPPELAAQRRLVAAFSSRLAREGHRVRQFETHISWVLVAGEQAWKFKKALRLDFLDCSTLEKRHAYCREELRLNRRLAPGLYLQVTAFTGTPEEPVPDGPGPAIEYAVNMQAFDQQALWSERIAHGLLTAAEVDQLAVRLAQFHRDIPCAPPGSEWGSLASLCATAGETLDTLTLLASGTASSDEVAGMRAWMTGQAQGLAPLFEQRRAGGKIRECHGDLHCANLLTLDGRAMAFDCIEFNDSMRWIDVVNDLAFLCMDLEFRGRRDYAMRALNAWLEHSGDYGAMQVFGYYRTLRALIRCKVAWLRGRQREDTDAAAACEQEGRAYLAFAEQSARPRRGAVLVMHGLSGSGKSTLAAMLAERIGAIRLRSDVERKRLHGLEPADRSGQDRLYAETVTRETYARLEELAATLAAAGWPALVDAAFLSRWQREQFRQLAQRLGLPFFLIDVQAPEALLRERVAARAAQGSDASDAGLAVLLSQVAGQEPLGDDEIPASVAVDTSAGIGDALLASVCASIAARLAS